ncbi:hypothetical protein KC333_g8529 [Hortaea werneckii]|nr:hypothetical protein KC333_g8529 [Hortaea werneckii]KAI7311072.1 hypothetical protein KC326_g6414 [Hortaea werneckii]
MEKRKGVFKTQDDAPLRKRPKRELADNPEPFTLPDGRSPVLLDVNDKSLPIQISSEDTRLKSEWGKPRYAGSRLPYVEPTASMVTDNDDLPMTDAPVVTGPADGQEAEASFEEIRKMVVDLKAQYPAYREDLEATEAAMSQDTGSNKCTPPIVLEIIDIIVAQELSASETLRMHLGSACEDLRKKSVHESRVRETEDGIARQDALHASAMQLRAWTGKMWKIWGQSSGLEG